MDCDKPRIIELPKVSDPRGNLSFIESGGHVPFTIRRAYWIYDVPGGMHRDGHAFRRQHELIVALSGSFDVVLDRGNGEERHHMARSYYGLHVPPMTWRKIDNFSTNSVVLVLSSETYDHSDYIEDYSQYLDELSRRQDAADSINDTNHNASHTPPPDTASNARQPLPAADVDRCRLIALDKHHHANGNLTVVQNGEPIPFDIRRAYYLYDIPGGEERGGHAHRQLRQLLVAISGSFDVVLDDGSRQRRVTLNRPYQGLLIVPGIWRVLENFSSGSVCLCLASEHFDESDYIRTHDEFRRLATKHTKQ